MDKIILFSLGFVIGHLIGLILWYKVVLPILEKKRRYKNKLKEKIKVGIQMDMAKIIGNSK